MVHKIISKFSSSTQEPFDPEERKRTLGGKLIQRLIFWITTDEARFLTLDIQEKLDKVLVILNISHVMHHA